MYFKGFVRKSHYGYRAICYYKRYGIWPFICSLFVIFILCCAYSYGSIDNVFCYLMTLVISAVGLAYKAHSDKEQKNEPVFKVRRACFDELMDIMVELHNLPSEDGSGFSKKRDELMARISNLLKKSTECFNSGTGYFFDSVRFAIIYYIDGRNGTPPTDLWIGCRTAEDFLTPFTEPKKFFKDIENLN